MKDNFGYSENQPKGLMGLVRALWSRFFMKSASKRQMRALMGVNTRIASGQPFSMRGTALK